MGNQTTFDKEHLDVFGRLKISRHQATYDSDFEYGPQPTRWESVTAGGGTITHLPALGGVRMRLGTTSGQLTIRQSRPYHRYQPGKAQRVTGAVVFGQALNNQTQRFGFFDDCNGAFFEQAGGLVVASNVLTTQASAAITAGTTTSITVAGTPWIDGQWAGQFAYFTPSGQAARITANTANTLTFVDAVTGLPLLAAPAAASNYSIGQVANPFGMAVVVRSDVNGTITERRVPADQWACDPIQLRAINFNLINMFFIEYAWYGAGCIRWGVTVNGRDLILHEIGFGNLPSQVLPWARTPHLPVRYEQRNTGVTLAQNDMIHWGVSVMTEGGQDDQRGFTYAYGMANQVPRRTIAANLVRSPVLAVRQRVMGTIEATQAAGAITAGTTTSITVAGTPWTVNQWVGRFVHFPTLGLTGRITANGTNTLTFSNVLTGGALAAAPTAGIAYTIGLVNRGQILPRQLLISASALCQIEIIMSNPSSLISLTGPTWAALSTLNSPGSFAERDVAATAITGGETVMRFTAPAGGSGLQTIDLSNLFPLYMLASGNASDILCIAATTPVGTAADVGCDIVCQEAMT